MMKICNSNATKQVIHKRQRRLLVIRGLLYFYVVVYCVHLHLNDSSLLTKGQMRDLALLFLVHVRVYRTTDFLPYVMLYVDGLF